MVPHLCSRPFWTFCLPHRAGLDPICATHEPCHRGPVCGLISLTHSFPSVSGVLRPLDEAYWGDELRWEGSGA